MADPEQIERVERELTRFTSGIMAEMERGAKILVALEKEAKPLLLRLFSLPSAGHISYVTIEKAFLVKDVLVDVRICLDSAHKDSPLVKEIVRAGITKKIHKEESYKQDYIVGTFTVGRVRVRIIGWLPETCRIEETVEVRPVDEDEYFLGTDGKVYHRHVVRKVVCGGD